MKKVTEQRTVDTWIAEDGRRFFDEESCERWEQEREDYKTLNELHSMEFEVPILTEEGVVYRVWYLIRNVKERDAVIRKYCSYAQYCYINGSSNGTKNDIVIGDWVIRAYKNDEDGREYRGVYTLSYVLENFKEFIKSIEEITVDGKC